MKYAIRDDDTCFFTKPADLKQAYRGLEGHCVCLSVIPDAVPDHGAEIHPYGAGIPWGYYPVEDNPELVEYVRQQIDAGALEICQHGCTHEYQDGRPEMLWKSFEKLSEEIAAGKQRLERAFGQKIRVFAAPSNAIGREAEAVLEDNHLDFSGIIRKGESRRCSVHYLCNYCRRWAVRLLYGIQYPGILQYGRHRELNAFPLRSWEEFLKQYQYCAGKNLPYVIYTHYWELNGDPDRKALLIRICSYLDSHGAACVPLSSLFGPTSG